MACRHAQFRCQDFGAEREEQVLANVSARRGRNRATWGDQFARANFAQAHVAGCAGYLSGKRDLGFLTGRSRQPPRGRLQTPGRNALVFIEQDAAGTLAELARWPDQTLSDPERAPLSERPCRSFPKRELSATARERSLRRFLRRLRATTGSTVGS